MAENNVQHKGVGGIGFPIVLVIVTVIDLRTQKPKSTSLFADGN
jgi:hypothetical protein